jgi:hypothetical protein
MEDNDSMGYTAAHKIKRSVKQKETTYYTKANNLSVLFQAIEFSPCPWVCLRHLSSRPLPYLQQVPPGRVVDWFLHLPYEEMCLETA